jgi:hypothetical protein
MSVAISGGARFVGGVRLTDGPDVDPYFKNVQFLLKTTAVNGATNNVIVDSSDYNRSMEYTNLQQGSFTPFWRPTGYNSVGGTPQNYSGIVELTGFYLKLPYNNDNPRIRFIDGNGSQTIEAFVFIDGPNVDNTYYIWYCDEPNIAISSYVHITNRKLCYGVVPRPYGGYSIIESQATIPIQQWTHCAVVITNESIRLYVNGQLQPQAYNWTTSPYFDYEFGVPNITYGDDNNHRTCYSWYNDALGYPAVSNGFYLSNLRISRGTRYSNSFTVPTAPFTNDGLNTQLLALQNNTRWLWLSGYDFVNTSGYFTTNNPTPPDSAYPRAATTNFNPFSPTTSYSATTNAGSVLMIGFNANGPMPRSTLGCVNNSGLTIGTNPFTIEFWMYDNVYGTLFDSYLFDFARSAVQPPAGQGYLALRRHADGFLDLMVNGDVVISTGVIKAVHFARIWQHVAVCRIGGTTTLYVNGVSEGTFVDSNNYLCDSNAPIFGRSGRSTSTNLYYFGYMANIRIVNGVGVYSGNFTPPTKPLEKSGAASFSCYPSTSGVNTTFPSSNTQLLLNFANSGIYDASGLYNIVTGSTAQVNTSVYKWSPGSVQFSGLDYLYVDGVNVTQTPVSTRAMPAGLRTYGGDEGPSAFTIEFWVNPNNFNNTQCILNLGGLLIKINTSGQITVTSTGTDITSSSYLIAGKWTYIGVTRIGTQVQLYFDGNLVGTDTSVISPYTGSRMFVGALGITAGEFFAGYIQDLRITVGIARSFDANVTPIERFPPR